MGEEIYFQKIQRVISDLQSEGYRVLYESVAAANDEEVATMSPEERWQYNSLEALLDLTRRFVLAIGLKYQSGALIYGADWIRCDTSMMDISRSLASSRYRPAALPTFMDELEDKFVMRAVRYILLNMPMVAFIGNLVCCMTPNMRTFHNIVVDQRNAIALDGIYRVTETGNDVVAIWGAEHLPGMIRSLRRQDFHICDIDWFTAFTTRTNFQPVRTDINELLPS